MQYNYSKVFVSENTHKFEFNKYDNINKSEALKWYDKRTLKLGTKIMIKISTTNHGKIILNP